MKIIINGEAVEVGGGGPGGESLDIYSTEETRIGTWIDGKPLYRRVFSGTYPQQLNTLDPNFQTTTQLSIDTLAKFNGMLHHVTSTYMQINDGEVPINMFAGSNKYIGAYLDSLGLHWYCSHSDFLGANYTIALEYTKTTDQPETTAHIYGASWDGSNTTKLTRTDDAALFTDPVPYVAGASAYGSPFDNLQPWAGMVESSRTGGMMVAIPKFWYKLTKNGNGLKIQIADSATEGFSVSPAHMDRGDGKGERDVVYVGRYHCGSDFKSNTGQTPKLSTTRANFRSGIHALGTNIWQADFAMRFTLWLLYLVEFADWNTQKTIGKGCGNNSAAQSMGYTDSMPYHTGTTQSSRDTYGLGTQYRNIEGLWDNCYDFCDGCYNNSNGLNIILNPNNFSDSSGGTSVGTPTSGWPSAFNVVNQAGFPMIIPSASNGGETVAACDYWSFNASNPVVYVGGNHNQNGDRGLFCVDYTGATGAHGDLGSRLQELP